MPKKQKLELTWIGKDQRPKLEPRILIEDPEKSYHASERVSENDIFDNMLIHGDNLLALKALEQEYAGKVKCVFIDPPYNTGSAFSHYDDGLEHSLWLSLIRARLEILKKLISKDGSIWISIDDNECHYLKVLCDEVFGRKNFVNNVIWQKKFSPQANATWLSDSHDHILVYAKNKDSWRPNLLPRSQESDSRYKNPDDDPRGVWTSGDFTISLTGGQRGAQYAKTGYSPNLYEITTPSGRKLMPTKGRCWLVTEDKYHDLVKDNRVWFGAKGNNVPRIKRFLTEVQDGIVAMTVWLRTEVGDNQDAKREVTQFNSDEIFSTPKPEKLIQRILTLSSKPGDLILDSFLGSGTTAAVAHKMGRRWIGVELGEHCLTHSHPRLKKIVDGDDPAGITETEDWKGGGGFRYYELGPSLISEDKWGNPVISKEFDPPKLTQAMCKLEGFDYAPDSDTYWMQGRSSETDFIYVTSQTMSKAALTKLSDEVGDSRSLLVCCPSFRAKEGDFTNLTLKKIPKAVLKKCEWGRDDYSLQIQELPKAPEATATDEEETKPKKPRRKFGKDNPNQGELF